MSTHHEQLPGLTPEAIAAHLAAISAIQGNFTISRKDLRRALSAFLLEAMRLVEDVTEEVTWEDTWYYLKTMAAILHSLPPPTLAQAREADLDTPEGKAAIRAFLATLGGLQT